jgi:hypothetical protein
MRGPILIGAGLLLLSSSICWSTLPVLTAVALISLGTTDTTLARPFAHARLFPLAIMHAATYTTLYALFLGATLHAANANSSQASWPLVLDIAVSLLLMALAAKRICTHLLQTIESQT